MRTPDRLERIEQLLRDLLDREARRDGYLDIRGASAYLSLSSKTIRGLISERKISAYKIGGKILISRAELDAFVQKQPVETIDIKEIAARIMAKINSAES